jgi:hypothetical protein
MDKPQPDKLTLTRARVRRPGERMTAKQRAAAQEVFITTYSQGHSITKSCKAAGVSRETLYAWKEHHETFMFRFNQAKEEGDDVIRDEIRRRGIEGWDEAVYQLGNYAGTVRKYSDRMLEIMAKARMPEYRDKVDVKATVQGNVTHDINLAADPEAAALAGDFFRRLTELRASESVGAGVSGE